MGKDITDSNRTFRWTSTSHGVPNQINLLVKKEILEIDSEDIILNNNEYKQDRYSYTLGKNAEKTIRNFVSTYGEKTINQEIHKYLGEPSTTNDTEIQKNLIIKKEAYLPTKQDFENLNTALKKSNINKYDLDSYLNFMQEHLDKQGKNLKENWRKITERNIVEIWAKK